MTTSSKEYRVPVSGGGDLDNSPRVAIFSIDEATAQEILTLSSLARAHNLHKVEKFDYRTRFLQFDPETDADDAEEAGLDNEVRTECDVLVVQKDEFSFAAYVKHTDVQVYCEKCSIEALLEHFGLKQQSTQADNTDAAPEAQRPRMQP